MPDPVLFGVGVLVTAIVALAVWSVGLLDADEEAAAERKTRPPQDERRR